MLRILLVLLFSATLTGAQAQDGPPAFAAVQAPEAGSGVCVRNGADTAIDCAKLECMNESGLGAEDCQLNAVCNPAGWAADLFMQHQEGLHWHTYLCGWQTQGQLEAAIALSCTSEWLIECSAVRMWTPEGEETVPNQAMQVQ